MKRRTKGVLLVGCAVVATAFAAVFVLTGVLAKTLDPQNNCATGFSRLIKCNYHWSSETTSQYAPPLFTVPLDATIPSSLPDAFRPTTVDATSWAVADCPRNSIARRLLCADAEQIGDDDSVSGLPRPKPWLLTTAKNSTVITAFHVETPLDVASVLRFYRLALSKRGWSENGGAVVEPGGAVVTFTTADGPAQLRLTHQDNRTIADLSLRKAAAKDGNKDGNKDSATDGAILPMPGQARLLLGNDTDEAAVITINNQTIRLPADTKIGRKSSESQDINKEIDLPAGKYAVSVKSASGEVKSREFEVAADETWGLVAGDAGVLFPLHIY